MTKHPLPLSYAAPGVARSSARYGWCTCAGIAVISLILMGYGIFDQLGREAGDVPLGAGVCVVGVALLACSLYLIWRLPRHEKDMRS